MIPVHPAATAAPSSEPGEVLPDALESARAWAAEAGLALVPVAERPATGDAGTDVVALDASGAVVLVVGVAELTPEALVDALARAATVRSVAPAELAAGHAGGSDGVRDAWWQLRSGATARPAAGPSLLLIATTVAPVVEAALPLLGDVVRVCRAEGAVEPAGAGAGVAEAAPAESAPKPVAKPGPKPGPRPGPRPAPAVQATVEPTPAPEPTAAVEQEDVQRLEPPEADADEPTAGGLTPHEQLQAVVALVGEASLVLPGENGGVSGRLLADGTIVVDGDSYAEPGSAASAALGRPVADGWSAWRFGADGPYLGEALQEALTQSAAPARPERPARPHRRRAVRG
ncbi:hypothetical protein C8046_08255 [Serinibacter arcticus]|uniref:RAMA domain-containing protein n=1 Tax=Serinibacter arcticus TaxID=1655435 RepID=A0A2U1ZUH7_9MICO|nr:hypothetical protein C8046_08255 [Serinibacter arcticus]